MNYFSKFPGVGPKQAARFVFYLLRRPKMEVLDFAESIKELREKTGICQECFFITNENQSKNRCAICSDKQREKTTICVVEKESDVVAIEKVGNFKGVYHILGGLIFSINQKNNNLIKVSEIKERIKKLKENGVKNIEIILALNPTTEGDATGLFIERSLEPFGVNITRLARGLSRGSDIEYLDEETIRHAIENREQKNYF